MKTIINSQGFKLNDYWSELIEKKIKGLDRLIDRFGEGILLKIAIISSGAHHEKGNSLKLKLTLEILKDNLVAEEEGDDLKTLLEKCVKNLKEQLVHKKEKRINQKRLGQERV
ncbi:MAG: HPF/RaiA family ribosome-associated protein [Minisyncoccia bacterium]|jgi:ribosome-associated translation inhibitor RaiA